MAIFAIDATARIVLRPETGNCRIFTDRHHGMVGWIYGIKTETFINLFDLTADNHSVGEGVVGMTAETDLILITYLINHNPGAINPFNAG